ncbi:MAG: hypothetical protein AAF468_22640 [Pseudomonadota bacterium]
MTPEITDQGRDLISEVGELIRQASKNTSFKREQAQLLIREVAWSTLVSRETVWVQITQTANGGKFILGVRVRLTVGDADDTPDVQLVVLA